MKAQTSPQLVDVETLHRVLEMEVVEDYRVAIDAGADRGAWTALMAVHFGKVIAFEEDAEAFQALIVNAGDLGNVDMHCKAVRDNGPASSGAAIDDLDLDHCGLVRIDAEGAELLALRGADRTIRRCRPVLIVAFANLSARFGHTDRMIQGHLIASGYRELFRSGADRVFVPK